MDRKMEVDEMEMELDESYCDENLGKMVRETLTKHSSSKMITRTAGTASTFRSMESSIMRLSTSSLTSSFNSSSLTSSLTSSTGSASLISSSSPSSCSSSSVISSSSASSMGSSMSNSILQSSSSASTNRDLTTNVALLKGIRVIDIHGLALAVKNRREHVLVIDSRSFLEYNTCHVLGAVNICCAKIVKRRLQQDKISILELVISACHFEIDPTITDVIVYDQGNIDVTSVPQESFLYVLLTKLKAVFRNVSVVTAGFIQFKNTYPELCEDKSRKSTLTTLSQPCISLNNQGGPTKILPFLYLGSQQDALNRELCRDHNITYELNVSISCPKPDFIQDSHFMRIPVNDNYSETLLPHLPNAVKFLDKVRESGGCVLVHCLAGMSRSATVAIAYVMRYLKMPYEEAYKYVKSKRTSISPNFNFLGQLLEYEKQLINEKILSPNESFASRRSSNSRSGRGSNSSSTGSLNSIIHSNSHNNLSDAPPLVEQTGADNQDAKSLVTS